MFYHAIVKSLSTMKLLCDPRKVTAFCTSKMETIILISQAIVKKKVRVWKMRMGVFLFTLLSLLLP